MYFSVHLYSTTQASVHKAAGTRESRGALHGQLHRYVSRKIHLCVCVYYTIWDFSTDDVTRRDAFVGVNINED